MIELLCGEDLEKLGIRSFGTLNMLAFWDHLETCYICREAKEVLTEKLDKVMRGKEER